MKIQKNVFLAPFTTIGLGGKAKFFAECFNNEEIVEALKWAKKENILVKILGGGSNVIFSDNGFSGLIIKVATKGYNIVEEDAEQVLLQAQGGENWDEFVAYTVEHGFAGVECLSGIPGQVGAVPIQNIGAYGQEVSESLYCIDALHRETFEVVQFQSDACHFSYRMSRFKNEDQGKYIIISVTFKLKKKFIPEFQYVELKKYLDSYIDFKKIKNTHQVLLEIRNGVIELRRKKSMIIDRNDPNSRSVGSFFLNPFLSALQFEDFIKKWKCLNRIGEIPHFFQGKDIKIPAAWLIEQAGFQKGYKKNGVGISNNHSLALVNYNGTSKELLLLAEEIREKVKDTFGIHLEFEPVIIK